MSKSVSEIVRQIKQTDSQWTLWGVWQNRNFILVYEPSGKVYGFRPANKLLYYDYGFGTCGCSEADLKHYLNFKTKIGMRLYCTFSMAAFFGNLPSCSLVPIEPDKPPHSIVIDGKTIGLSEESFNQLKKQLT